MHTKSKSNDHLWSRQRERACAREEEEEEDLFTFNDDTVESMATVHSRKWSSSPFSAAI
jgi:hypothetical protein